MLLRHRSLDEIEERADIGYKLDRLKGEYAWSRLCLSIWRINACCCARSTMRSSPWRRSLFPNTHADPPQGDEQAHHTAHDEFLHSYSSTPQTPLTIASILLRLLRPDGDWPAAFDKGQHGPGLGVGERLLISRHGATIARGGMVFAPVLDNFE